MCDFLIKIHLHCNLFYLFLMETVKTALCAMLLTEYGPGVVLELETSDRCIKIELPISRDHVIYVRPDDRERNFICHYAHREDLHALAEELNGDKKAFKEHNIAQLPWHVKGTMRDFVRVTMQYVRMAAERIEQMKGLGGRRISPMVETFAEARYRTYHFPDM
jgi:hypothetical protein